MKERKISAAPLTPVGWVGYSRKFYAGRLRPRSILLLFCISFEQESNPFCIPVIHERYPFSKLLNFLVTETIAAILRENIHGYLSADIICSEKRTVFRERTSRKTVRFSEQICPRTNIRAHFRLKWRLLSLLSFISFSQRSQFSKLGNILGYSPVLAGEYSVTWRA